MDLKQDRLGIRYLAALARMLVGWLKAHDHPTRNLRPSVAIDGMHYIRMYHACPDPMEASFGEFQTKVLRVFKRLERNEIIRDDRIARVGKVAGKETSGTIFAELVQKTGCRSTKFARSFVNRRIGVTNGDSQSLYSSITFEGFTDGEDRS